MPVKYLKPIAKIRSRINLSIDKKVMDGIKLMAEVREMPVTGIIEQALKELLVSEPLECTEPDRKEYHGEDWELYFDKTAECFYAKTRNGLITKSLSLRK